MKVTVFCENDEGLRNNPRVRKAYPNGFGQSIAAVFGKNTVFVPHDKGEDGSALLKYLEDTDVLVWWGHGLHKYVSDEVAEAVADRVKRGMGLIALHSSHMSKPFLKLIGTTGTLRWRESGDNERLWVVNPAHPICEGVGEYVELPHEETYGEYFDIPAPDELVFIGWFKGGEVFRSGCVFNRGFGKVFYFQPGHETFPTFRYNSIKRILKNAASYVAPKHGVGPALECKHTPAPQKR